MPTPSKKSSSVLPTGGGQALLDISDTVFLLLDHQSGLLQTVKDISVAELRANTTMLAKLAALLKIPVITTASEHRAEWSAHAGNPRIRTPCRLRAA
jgi:nicotinamidase-related amidase